MGDPENINTFSQILIIFKSIHSGGLIQPGNIPFSITALLSIKALWFWINDRLRRNQSWTGSDFNKYQRNAFHEIYRGVQEHSEAKHDNEWTLPKCESNAIFPEWGDFMLNVMENEKFSADNHTPIKYLLRKQEAPTMIADLPDGLIHL